MKKVKLTKLQKSYLEDRIFITGIGNQDREDDYKVDQIDILEQELRDGLDITPSDYVREHLESDVERMHPSQSDNDWASVQEYTYALRFFRKIMKARGEESYL